MEQVPLDVRNDAPDGLHAARLSALRERLGLAPADVPADSLASIPQPTAPTAAGRGVADTWDRLVNPDPRQRLEIDSWPEPRDE